MNDLYDGMCSVWEGWEWGGGGGGVGDVIKGKLISLVNTENGSP